ncbi:MAG: hypothetical protein WC798_03845 [Candidatus Paceibacterota bacterium]|jgi:hypothetical protein
MDKPFNGFLVSLVIVIAGSFLAAGGAYAYRQMRQADVLSDEQALQIAKKVIAEDLNDKRDLACMSFASIKDSGFITYTVTKIFSDTCPGDPTSTPTIPDIKINLMTGETFFQAVDGIFRPLIGR